MGLEREKICFKHIKIAFNSAEYAEKNLNYVINVFIISEFVQIIFDLKHGDINKYPKYKSDKTIIIDIIQRKFQALNQKWK